MTFYFPGFEKNKREKSKNACHMMNKRFCEFNRYIFFRLKMVDEFIDDNGTKQFFLFLDFVPLIETDLVLHKKGDTFCGVPSCLFSSRIYLWVVFVCVCVSWLAGDSEQKHIGVTEHLDRQLDLDLYLGVHAGENQRAHAALCVRLRLWIRQAFSEQSHSSLAVAQGLQGPMCAYRGLSCTAR